VKAAKKRKIAKLVDKLTEAQEIRIKHFMQGSHDRTVLWTTKVEKLRAKLIKAGIPVEE